MAFVIYFILLTVASSIYATSFSLAKQVAQPFSTRALNAAGGWALSQSTCPTDMTTCNLGSCCPSSLTCVHIAGSGIANLCCPGTTQCTAAFAAVPFCADNSWSLWDAADEAAQENEQSGYFCCLPGQVGLQTGDCVDSNTEVPASLSASLVIPGSSTAVASSSISPSTVASSSISSSLISSSTVSTTTTVSSSSPASSTTTQATSRAIETTNTSTTTASITSSTASHSLTSATGTSGAAAFVGVEMSGIWGSLLAGMIAVGVL